jgi:hypothetical protein
LHRKPSSTKDSDNLTITLLPPLEVSLQWQNMNLFCAVFLQLHQFLHIWKTALDWVFCSPHSILHHQGDAFMFAHIYVGKSFQAHKELHLQMFACETKGLSLVHLGDALKTLPLHTGEAAHF